MLFISSNHIKGGFGWNRLFFYTALTARINPSFNTGFMGRFVVKLFSPAKDQNYDFGLFHLASINLIK